MSERAEALAKRFEQVNDELIAAVEGCSDEQWRKTCSGEQWSVAVTAHHVAPSPLMPAWSHRPAASGRPLRGAPPPAPLRPARAAPSAMRLTVRSLRSQSFTTSVIARVAWSSRTRSTRKRTSRPT